MKKLTYLLMPLAVALSLAACSDYDNGYTKEQLQYAKDFKEVFGEIDSEQDWNAAERTSVTVTTSQASAIKIYALVDGTYSIVGDYAGVSGTQELGIDVRKGVTQLIVSDGKEAVKTTVGEAVNFSGTRTTYPGNDVVEINKITDAAGMKIGEKLYPMYKEVVKADYTALADPSTGAVPEIGERKTYTNLNKVVHDFSYVSTGKFVVYPYYWVTSNTNTIGIYYYEGGQRVEVPLYTIKGGDELQYLTKPGQEPYWQDIFDFTDPRNARDYNWAAAGYTSENFKPAVWTVNQYDNTKYDLTKVAQILVTPNGSWQSYTGADCNEIFSNTFNAQKVRGQGIVVDIPEGTVFGMYLLDASGFKCYSQSELNTSNQCGPGVTDDGNGNVKDDDAVRPCYASTFHIGDQMFLGFEDWKNQWKNSDMDFNDVVLAFSGATPTIIDEDPKAATWILACEDLGGSFDTDYNDVVLKVEHVSGQATAKVTPLAAGGTLASYIFYNDPVADSYDEQCVGEVHQLFGRTPTTSGNYAPINVGTSRGTAGAPQIINVDVNWSMAYYSAAEWNTTQQYNTYNMGGFEIRVLPEGEEPLTGTIHSTNDKFGEGSVIAAPGKGEAPMMLCLPYTYEKTGTDGKVRKYVWAWSRELCSLSSGQGYGEGSYPQFAAWVEDHTVNAAWYMYPAGNTVDELILSEEDSSTGGGDGGEGGETLTSNIPWANGQSFTYKDKNNNLTGYSNAAFIDFSGVTDPDGYTATLAVTFASMPGCTIYWDYKTGEQIIDDYGSGYKTSGTLSLTAEQFHKAKKTGGIYIVGYGNTPIVLTSANLTTTYGAPVTFDDDDDNTGEDGSNYGTQVLTSIISGTSTVPASAFASANTKVYLTFLYKAGGRSYTQFYTQGQYSQLQKETQDITPDTDTYVTITISDTDWINGLKTYGITGFQDWNNGVLAANFGGLWIRCE